MKIPHPERITYSDLPTGFGMALMHNPEAYNRFFLLSDEQRLSVIEGVHGITSDEEMRNYVTRTLIGSSPQDPPPPSLF